MTFTMRKTNRMKISLVLSFVYKEVDVV